MSFLMTKKMIHPVNNHLLIQPVKQDSFIANQKDTYEEIGEVLALDENINQGISNIEGTSLAYTPDEPKVTVGDKVYFDSWLAAKFPAEEKDEFYWLVKWEDVRAVEHGEE